MVDQPSRVTAPEKLRRAARSRFCETPLWTRGNEKPFGSSGMPSRSSQQNVTSPKKSAFAKAPARQPRKHSRLEGEGSCTPCQTTARRSSAIRTFTAAQRFRSRIATVSVRHWAWYGGRAGLRQVSTNSFAIVSLSSVAGAVTSSASTRRTSRTAIKALISSTACVEPLSPLAPLAGLRKFARSSLAEMLPAFDSFQSCAGIANWGIVRVLPTYEHSSRFRNFP